MNTSPQPSPVGEGVYFALNFRKYYIHTPSIPLPRRRIAAMAKHGQEGESEITGIKSPERAEI